MKPEISQQKQTPAVDIELLAGLLAKMQKASGEIPWSEGGKTDPWDHIEAAMGLCIGGYVDEARRAYEWLADIQLEDGAWYASYIDGKPLDRTRDTNVSTYIAVGVYHYYLITRDLTFVHRMWNTVAAAMEFAIRLQAPTGEIYWAKSPEMEVDPMALLTGSSSIYMSLKCALAISRLLGHETALLGNRQSKTRRRPAGRVSSFQHHQIPLFHGLVLSGAFRRSHRCGGPEKNRPALEKICC